MKIAIAASGKDLDARVDPRFGRAPYFLIVETPGMSLEALANPHASRPAGAGVASAEMLVEKGVEAVVAGVCGPNSFDTLSAAGVQVVTGVSGTAGEAVGYFAGAIPGAAQVPPAGAPSQQETPVGPTAGAPGGGFGRGRGGGWGRGMGFGMGPAAQGPYIAGQLAPEQEKEMLGAQLAQLEEALRTIRQRLEELEQEGQK